MEPSKRSLLPPPPPLPPTKPLLSKRFQLTSADESSQQLCLIASWRWSGRSRFDLDRSRRVRKEATTGNERRSKSPRSTCVRRSGGQAEPSELLPSLPRAGRCLDNPPPQQTPPPTHPRLKHKRLDGSLETAGREDGNDEEGKEDGGNYARW